MYICCIFSCFGIRAIFVLDFAPPHLFRDVWNIPVMEKIIKERFHGKYPVRKSIETNFAHAGGEKGLLFQADAIAYCG